MPTATGDADGTKRRFINAVEDPKACSASEAHGEDSFVGLDRHIVDERLGRSAPRLSLGPALVRCLAVLDPLFSAVSRFSWRWNAHGIRIGVEEPERLIEQLEDPPVLVLHALQLLNDGHGRLPIETSGMTRGEKNDRTAEPLQIMTLERHIHGRMVPNVSSHRPAQEVGGA